MALMILTASIVNHLSFPLIVMSRAPGWKQTESRLDYSHAHLVIEAPGWKGYPLRWQRDLVGTWSP